jgi:transcriptional regulator with XRE-family HTH domain
MLIGEKLKAARELGNISSRELDRLAGLREGVSWKVESSKTGNVETKTLAAQARVLGLDLEYLVNDAGTKPTRDSVQAAIARARNPAPRKSGRSARRKAS